MTRPARGSGFVNAVRALALALACAGLFVAPAEAGGRFDGDWAIYIYGAPGPCAFGYKLPIRIDRGNILYRSRQVSSRAIAISAAGAVAIRIGDGRNMVTGSGALAGTRGSGKWVAPAYRCTGSWRAVKQ